MNASEQLKKIREVTQLNQTDFATALNVKTASISNIENGSREIPKNLMKELVSKMNVSAQWLLTGEGEMFQDETQTTIQHTTAENPQAVPYYDIDVMAHIAMALDQIEQLPSSYLVIPGFTDSYACFPVFGESMEPKINNGDIIAVSKPIEKTRILWGEIHMIVTDEWRVIKTIHPGHTEEYVILRSINPAYAGDTQVPKDDIRALYLVRGVVSRMMM